MKNLFRHSASLICLLAVSACASSPPPPPAILVKAARLQVPPLQPWILEPVLLPISTQQLQQVLNPSAKSTTKP